MHSAIEQLKAAIGYADFSDVGVENAVNELITVLGNDLAPDAADYVQTEEVDAAVKSLIAAMNESDNTPEDISSDDDDDDEELEDK